jgi:hypothetical protein
MECAQVGKVLNQVCDKFNKMAEGIIESNL